MKILLADSFPDTHAATLTKSGHQITSEPSLDADTMVGAIEDHDILIVRSTKVTAATLDAARNLKLVIRAGAGTNTIDKTHAAEKGISVCNVPGANSIAVAELVMGLIISIDRNIHENVSDLRSDKWNKKKYSKSRGLYGQKIGILGLGSIGLAVAERARAFGIESYSVAKSGRSREVENRIQASGIRQLDSIDDVLGLCDIISIHMPSTPQTQKMINAGFLSKMKDGAMLINSSRGDLVDETALLEAMNTRGIRAGLDVYDNEPSTGEGAFHSEIAKHPNTCGTHHIGASTEQAQIAVADGVLRVIESFESDQLIFCVNS
ncbi:MAG: hydroxyacid dehydrogenase [Gammaproteobacteria bacterium]|nr:hydroxyacid dehydrogenase [Gammaproteobacteria bacterium]